jgi:hypothetical protein
MALRIEKAACILLNLALAAAAQSFEFPVRHDHAFRDRPGTLRITSDGVAYTEAAGERPSAHRWTWAWTDIQQLYVSERRLSILTYQDSTWRLGVDREYAFEAAPGRNFAEVYRFLRQRLDQRLVAALADEDVRPLWQVPAKLLGRLWGSEGVLIVGPDRIVYKTARPGLSRTWRYQDIENLSSSGPFELTITTFERSKFHYGNRRAFNFQLKQALDETRYDELWRRLNVSHGLRLLTETAPQPAVAVSPPALAPY